MKTNATVSLISVINDESGENRTELVTKAHVSSRNNRYEISYEDTETTGFEGCITTVTADGCRSASVVRDGYAGSVLVLETGKKHYCQYDTPFGTFQLGVSTQVIKNTLNSNGRLYMKYSLDVNASYLSDNEIIITVMRDKNKTPKGKN